VRPRIRAPLYVGAVIQNRWCGGVNLVLASPFYYIPKYLHEKMKKCIRCNQPIEIALNFCPTCGEDQRGENTSNATFLIVLCVFTIIGSVFTMGRAFLYEMISISVLDESHTYLRGWVYFGSAIGTIVGAFMMIQKKMRGLYIYSIFQIIYILTVIIASFSYGSHGEALSLVAIGMSMFFIVPSILFLVLYWTDIVKRNLS